ncbi:MAG: amidohydrolase [Verrucomicrobia bacterium]|nr:MAG: amidohydrolase [Verrucomicrobiota bacterium]
MPDDLSLDADAAAATGVPENQSKQIATLVEALRPTLIETRRDIHKHPELANREVRTSQVVIERLRELGVDQIRTNVAGHGVVALLKGAKPGPVVAMRADMDALPITETRDLPYKSTVPGVMHACGHDAHTAIGLGVAAVLSQIRDQIHGAVKLLFEPAEESPPPGEEGGARLMIKEGALENPRPAAIFGLHVSPEIEVGKLGCRSGTAQASLDGFDITIRGRPAFVLRPEQGADAIAVAAQCVTALELVRSRGLSTFEPVLLNIGWMHGGERRFSLAQEVKMEGCLRTLNEEVRQRAMALLRQTLKGITEANGATFELNFTDITAVLYNNPRLVAGAMPVVRQMVGQANLAEVAARLGGEDFSYFAQVVPGCFFRLGCGNARKGITAPIHSPDFDLDEECLVVGARTMSAVLLNYLNRHAQ